MQTTVTVNFHNFVFQLTGEYTPATPNKYEEPISAGEPSKFKASDIQLVRGGSAMNVNLHLHTSTIPDAWFDLKAKQDVQRHLIRMERKTNERESLYLLVQHVLERERERLISLTEALEGLAVEECATKLPVSPDNRSCD